MKLYCGIVVHEVRMTTMSPLVGGPVGAVGCRWVVLNCRCGSVHQTAQQRDFVAVRGRRLLLGFENHRELGHGRIVDQSREERDRS